MDADAGISSSFCDPEDLSARDQYRRYKKRSSALSRSHHGQVSLSKLSEVSPLYDGESSGRRPNAALFLDDIKQEAESFDADYLEKTPSRVHQTSNRRSSFYSPGAIDAEPGYHSVHRSGSYSSQACKLEEDALADGAESAFGLFASSLDYVLQGVISAPDLILQFESCCRDVSEAIRYGDNERHRVIQDKLMRQNAQFLLQEAASWSLLWHLYGKESEEIPEDVVLSPPTSHLEACRFLVDDHTAQLCLRIVQWIEGLASKALDLDNKVRGSHVGSHIASSGVWHQTQRFLKKGHSNQNTICHLDFDAPTREHAQPLPDDKKQDESLLEDVWTLLIAGRLEEACGLCRAAGQPWRAAMLTPFGGLDQFPSIEALLKNGKNRAQQAFELESGVAHQYLLWKWASYCASEKIAEQDGGKYETAVYAAQCSNLKRMLPVCMDWETACWALAKSWLDVQVDLELGLKQPDRTDLFRSYEDSMDKSQALVDHFSQTSAGPEYWPLQVQDQQPQNIASLLQKLHSRETVHEVVARGCKEQQRQIQMDLMVGDIPHLLDLIWSWISPSEDDENVFRLHDDCQMVRFGAHLVLLLRYLLLDQVKDAFEEKLMIVGDLILNMYVMFLFSNQREDLVGIYASQLASQHCIDLFVHMMELRLDSSVHVKYKIFLSAIIYLPFSPSDDSKGSFEEIIERVLSRSREIKPAKYDKSFDVVEQHRLQSLQKALVVQWLCFTPPSKIKDVKAVRSKLLLQALTHSNILFREFALVSMWRVPTMPIGAHTLLGFLAEPLKQPAEPLFLSEEHDFAENFREFQYWSEFYSIDATYRKWLKFELENAEVSPLELSLEERQRVVAAAKETLEASMQLLDGKSLWLITGEDYIYETLGPVFIELHATAILSLPSGECICPDAPMCATLLSALYSSVDEEVVSHRQLMVNVYISTKDAHSIEVVLLCLASEGDGIGPHEFGDGGILAAVIAAGFKGELVGFQAGVTLEISRIDARWYSVDGSQGGPATYIVRGLCRRCCLPEIILRCMQVSISLAEAGDSPDTHEKLVELVASPQSGLMNLFSQHQLQEFLLFEREYEMSKMGLQEGLAA